ncbi:MAG: membrane dipeptidase [Paracoccaceae bacterium]
MTRSDPVFDGHNDMLLKLWRVAPEGRAETLFETGAGGHLDLPRLRAGNMAAGLYAMFVPSAGFEMATDGPEGYDVPLPAAIPQAEALPVAIGQAGILIGLDRAGLLRLCRTADEAEAARRDGVPAAFLHLEGAEAIDAEFRALDVLQAAGLVSLGPVWSRPTAFGHGVPFRFPSGPDTGPGLTDLGRELVRQCDARRIMLDLSHLNEAGFWDVAELSDRPLVATHSNAHALVPHARNLTDRQLDAIRERGGMVGVNLATAFLRDDGRMDDLETLEPVVRQFAYLVERLGEDRVGLGSDFDGARVPSPIGDAGGLPALAAALRAAGFGEALVGKLLWGNWIGTLRAVQA